MRRSSRCREDFGATSRRAEAKSATDRHSVEAGDIGGSSLPHGPIPVKGIYLLIGLLMLASPLHLEQFALASTDDLVGGFNLIQ